MNRASLAILSLTALAGCHSETPQQEQAERAAKDARAVAMVERVQHQLPPIDRLSPEPVAFADLRRPGVSIHLSEEVAVPAPGEGCHFHAASGGPAIFVATPGFALAKFDGRLEVFAADSGSPQLSTGLHRDYPGGAHAVRLTESADGSVQTLAILDKYDRVAYSAAGRWQCGPAPGPAGR